MSGGLVDDPVLQRVSAPKEGAFTNWTDNREQVELSLPLPHGTTRRDVIVLIGPHSLSVRHRHVGLLLEATPLAQLVIADESTWYIDGPMLVVVLAKQDYGGSPAGQYWGASLTAPGGILECHLSPRDLATFLQRRERELEREAAEKRAAREREAELERVLAEREAAAAALRAEDEAAAAAEQPSWVLDHLHLIVAAAAVLVGAVRMYLLTMQWVSFQRDATDGGGVEGLDVVGAAGAAAAGGVGVGDWLADSGTR
ncbi:hypothetical protein KFE25_003340 [Diacronema lutheri]|uniref:CS domain-containing protein n=1 Tax=Diacronema lutheri TaxID=2081491 RepID=A0A8J5XHT3_DIALT|nr:hypothetical protein KFE25_003340 [Diacronema lutheri]|mmetsp:Transcript_17955/g.55902  ORF Transcript_17955/g.55902 Transcript_17955/m.55902 type:complete len:256 (-) Transcript_17955:189-956(-)